MPKINQEEYEILQFLNNTKDWIVRNPDGQVWAVEGENPTYSNFYESWQEGDGRDAHKLETNLFQFVKWGDEEPYNIAELIEEYESEETEVKDLRWAKKTISELRNNKELDRTETNLNIEVGKLQRWAWNNCIDRVLEILNQLDEPETLSQEWVDENSKPLQWHENIVPVSKLQNLLVPKQEEVDRAYRKGFKEGERQTAEYFESITEEPSKEQVWKYLSEHGIEVVDKEPETVASVIADFYKSLERFKEVLGTKIEGLEE